MEIKPNKFLKMKINLFPIMKKNLMLLKILAQNLKI